jgi:hypothetical protein
MEPDRGFRLVHLSERALFIYEIAAKGRGCGLAD